MLLIVGGEWVGRGGGGVRERSNYVKQDLPKFLSGVLWWLDTSNTKYANYMHIYITYMTARKSENNGRQFVVLPIFSLYV